MNINLSFLLGIVFFLDEKGGGKDLPLFGAIKQDSNLHALAVEPKGDVTTVKVFL